MTIVCQKEFADACEFAATADDALETEIAVEKDEKLARKLQDRRGQACRSLLHCLGCLAKWDADGNDLGLARGYSAETRIVGPDGVARTVGSSPKPHLLPRKETYVFTDIAPHSFFFREELVDPETRQPVRVVDTLYYVFLDPKSVGDSLDDVEKMTDDELLMKAMNGDCLLCRSAAEVEQCAGKANGSVTRRVERERRGLCGGVIYHADYADGRPAPYGRWQIHT